GVEFRRVVHANAENFKIQAPTSREIRSFNTNEIACRSRSDSLPQPSKHHVWEPVNPWALIFGLSGAWMLDFGGFALSDHPEITRDHIANPSNIAWQWLSRPATSR